MLYTSPFPNEFLYLIVKICVLIMVMLIWLTVTASPAT